MSRRYECIREMKKASDRRVVFSGYHHDRGCPSLRTLQGWEQRTYEEKLRH